MAESLRSRIVELLHHFPKFEHFSEDNAVKLGILAQQSGIQHSTPLLGSGHETCENRNMQPNDTSSDRKSPSTKDEHATIGSTCPACGKTFSTLESAPGMQCPNCGMKLDHLSQSTFRRNAVVEMRIKIVGLLVGAFAGMVLAVGAARPILNASDLILTGIFMVPAGMVIGLIGGVLLIHNRRARVAKPVSSRSAIVRLPKESPQATSLPAIVRGKRTGVVESPDFMTEELPRDDSHLSFVGDLAGVPDASTPLQLTGRLEAINETSKPESLRFYIRQGLFIGTTQVVMLLTRHEARFVGCRNPLGGVDLSHDVVMPLNASTKVALEKFSLTRKFEYHTSECRLIFHLDDDAYVAFWAWLYKGNDPSDAPQPEIRQGNYTLGLIFMVAYGSQFFLIENDVARIISAIGFLLALAVAVSRNRYVLLATGIFCVVIGVINSILGAFQKLPIEVIFGLFSIGLGAASFYTFFNASRRFDRLPTFEELLFLEKQRK
jgi:hypothetical protein